jgi:Glyoxalase-like domain
MRAVLDHVVVDVRDRLEETAAACERLGFRVTPPSENTFGSINRLCVFANTYLELLSVGPRASAAQRDRLANPAGANGLVFRTDDTEAMAAELRRRGIAAGDVRAFSRPVEIHGAVAQARFETVHADLAGFAPLRSYFCRHFTPELIWRADCMNHPNGALDISRITLAAHDVGGMCAWFRRAFDEVPEWIAIDGAADGDARAASIASLRIETPAPRGAQTVDGLGLTIEFR